MSQDIKTEIVNGETSLGIEFGSTRIKAVLIDSHFKTIASHIYDWENQLLDGYWTYPLEEVIVGLQEVYEGIKQQVENRYKIKLTRIGSIGCSAMMQGYIALNKKGQLLVPFRTWRNTTTTEAAEELTKEFNFKIPQRWSIAHLYQAIINDEEHVKKIDYITTLSGYIHWRLTGHRSIGICDASGMFPIDQKAQTYDTELIHTFNQLVDRNNYPWKLEDILPNVCMAGEVAGKLSQEGALLIDPSGDLQPNIPMCPPEGDGGTGMVATNCVKTKTGNVSVGTSIFAMFVLDKSLSQVHAEIDIISTPDGNPVAMVLANNCSTEINAWIGLFREAFDTMGVQTDRNEIYSRLFNAALDADDDGGGLLSYGYYSGEPIAGFSEGRPLLVRSPKSHFNIANFMRSHLFSAFAVLRLGLDILRKEEQIAIDNILAHGGLFKTPVVGQKICAAALDVPVTVMSTAGEGGAWGMAVLASYVLKKETEESLSDYLTKKVFNNNEGLRMTPDLKLVNDFLTYLKRYIKGFAIEQAAIDHLDIT